VVNPNLALPMILICILATPGRAALAQSGQSPGDTLNGGIGPVVPAAGGETLTDSPPTPPHVVCTGNQLTISTNNSTLASVLADVHNCIGVRIDVPDGAASSRVFDNLGPGPAREVLSSLLSSTGFDFVIGSSESDPDKVETVLLMAHASDKSTQAVQDMPLTPGRRKFLLMQKDIRTGAPPEEQTTPPENTAPVTPAKDDTAVAPVENPAANPDQTPSNDQSPVAPVSSPVQPVNPISPSPDTTPPSTQSSDTQDQITNMEKLFEQRRQMNQNPSPQSPQ
jgi:hypothetical protein